MLWDVLILSRKLIYKEKCGAVVKSKCKKATKVFQACLSTIYDSFILELSISISTALLFCCCGDNVKCGLLSKHLCQRKRRQYGGWKNLTVTTNF